MGTWTAFWAIFVLPHVGFWVSLIVYGVGSCAFLQLDRVSAAEPKRLAPLGEESERSCRETPEENHCHGKLK
jgi:hypothetical protein